MVSDENNNSGKSPLVKTEIDRRTVVKTIGVGGMGLTAIPNNALAKSEKPLNEEVPNKIQEASRLFRKFNEKHGDVSDSDIKFMANGREQAMKDNKGKIREVKIKYHFKDGAKLPVHFREKKSIIEAQIANDVIEFNKEEYVDYISSELGYVCEKTKEEMNKELKEQRIEVINNE